MIHTEKTMEQLDSMIAKRLLAYYKAERARCGKASRQYVCECCGEQLYHVDEKPVIDKHNEDIELWETYLEKIKLVLSTKEHVKK